LTCFPSTTTFVLVLGADSPCSDERGAGNLGLTARGLFTLFNATHVSIRTSDTSSSLLKPPSQAYRTLPYHVDASLELARLSMARSAVDKPHKRGRAPPKQPGGNFLLNRKIRFAQRDIDASASMQSAAQPSIGERVQVKRLHPQLRLPT
jgi:hypothetical protein